MGYFESLDPLLQTYWLIAIATSIFFILQTIMTIIGAGSHGHSIDFGDSSGSMDTTAFQLFSLRNLINFLLGFSWTGVSCYSSIANKTLLMVLSVVVGLLFVFLFFVIIKQLQKLAEDNSFKIIDTLYQTAEVYLTIPENRKGKGKIIISVHGSFHELEAMTENEQILTGSVVRVISVENENTIIVEKI